MAAIGAGVSAPLLFVALSLASYRVWRLAGRDDITEPIRSHLPGFLQKLVRCEWCLGSYVSVASVYATHRWLVVLRPHWLLWAVAVSCVVGLIGTRLDT